MRRIGVVCVLAVLAAVIGCEKGGGTTPQATFEAYKSAMANKDFDAVWDMLSADAQRRLDEQAAQLAQAAAKAEGPAKTDIEMKAKLFDMTMDEMKALDGRKLVTGVFRMAAKMGTNEFGKIGSAQVERVDTSGDRASVFVKIEGKVEKDPLYLTKEGTLWKVALPEMKPAASPAPVPQ
jgi:hypothetical protein